MVGKSYRTPDDEIRTVQSIDNGEAVYRAASGAAPTMIERVVDQKLRSRTSRPRWTAK